MKKKIEICRGDEYSTKLSNIYCQEDFFYESYCKAAQGVRDIVRATRRFYDWEVEDQEWRPSREGNSGQGTSNVTEYMQLAGYPNNFVVFCAGRGQGKTSAMVSFSTALRMLHGSERGSKTEREFWREEIVNSSFYVLDPIDPTMLDEEDSILRVLISRMFERYAEEQDDLCRRRSGYHDQEPDLLKRFRQCYRNVDILQKGRQLQDCYDDLEYLADLGDSSNMKRTFHALVTLFLKLMCGKSNGSSRQYLVIQIDDADLNASNAYQIVEELRKYCVVPNVIILMASDFEQLELTVEQYFIGEFDTLRKSRQGDKTVLEHCHKMMERYLDKLIPGTRQVHLPQIDNYIREHENELLLQYIEETQEDDGMKIRLSGDYQDTLLQLIYQKLRLILLKPEGYLHNLLPKTMRELTHFLAFLNGLPEIPVEGGVFSKVIDGWRSRTRGGEMEVPPEAQMEAWSQRRTTRTSNESAEAVEVSAAALAQRWENIDAFMDYLRHCWIKSALNEKQQAVVIPAMEATADLKIKELLVNLEEYGAEKYTKDWGEANQHPGSQYTDVVGTLVRLKSLMTGSEDFNLIYISATILTLYMHQLAIKDLGTGLEFTGLTRFIGGGIFLPSVGKFEYQGLRYDQLDVTYDLLSAAAPASGTLGQTSRDTQVIAGLLLSKGEDQLSARKMPDIPFLSEEEGNRVALLQLFSNCLRPNVARKLMPSTTTEILDIVLSWDLQYKISKRMRDEAVKQEGSWLLFETWLGNRLDIVDETYQGGLNALEIDTTKATLKSTLVNELHYAEMLAMGNPNYAAGWWGAAKTMLVEKLDKVDEELENLNEGTRNTGENAEWDSTHLFASLTRCGRMFSDLDKNELLMSSIKLLEFGPLYAEGITPQGVMDEAMQIVTINELAGVMKAMDGRMSGEEASKGQAGGLPSGEDVKRLLKEVGDIPQLRRKLKGCRKKLDGISLCYFPQKQASRKTGVSASTTKKTSNLPQKKRQKNPSPANKREKRPQGRGQ